MNTEIPTPETIDEVQQMITDDIEEKSQLSRPRNRAERRTIAKKIGKKGREQFGSISETAKKLNYINLTNTMV